ncbi:MAG TPA: 2-amino-4-hydroxy-6-hydroxymethyldihydropteridine diphosphokinase [Candidatus Rubrimentiphilum sp.]|nr:2-amino-4-hydroxy-6-hydroxymethyldihydropteridine diphosphokinase [Candidatus Rubrimentiphilum sp.]
MTRAGIGIGANSGDARTNVVVAIDALGRLGTLVARSRLYRTKPWGKTDQPDFVNAAAIIETALTPRELLDGLKQLETELGRTPGARWGPRVIDLDILFYGDVQLDQPGLRIPHPRLHERAFALIPLAEIDSRYAEAAAALPAAEREGVEANP